MLLKLVLKCYAIMISKIVWYWNVIFGWCSYPYNFGGMFWQFITQVIHDYIKAEQYIVGIENKSLGSMQFMYNCIVIFYHVNIKIKCWWQY
jgi:hypothetical protein